VLVFVDDGTLTALPHGFRILPLKTRVVDVNFANGLDVG
jgi:hypothetical protein